MKNINYSAFYLKCYIIASICFIFSCKKQSENFVDASGIYMDKEKLLSKDSVTYSFSEKPNLLMVDTIKLPVKISGIAKNYDRVVPLKINEILTTAKQGTHFEIIETKVKANEYLAVVPIVVRRTADLKVNQVRLALTLVTDNEFSLIIDRTKTVGTLQGENLSTYRPNYLIKINDQFLKPDSWSLAGSWYQSFFGDYSEVKFRYVIAVTGKAVWGIRARDSAESPTLQQMEIYYTKLILALEAYERANGPMLDENGNQVTFPKK